MSGLQMGDPEASASGSTRGRGSEHELRTWIYGLPGEPVTHGLRVAVAQRLEEPMTTCRSLSEGSTAEVSPLGARRPQATCASAGLERRVNCGKAPRNAHLRRVRPSAHIRHVPTNVCGHPNSVQIRSHVSKLGASAGLSPLPGDHGSWKSSSQAEHDQTAGSFFGTSGMVRAGPVRAPPFNHVDSSLEGERHTLTGERQPREVNRLDHDSLPLRAVER